MTHALCLYCGGGKFGALNPCPDCGNGSTGDMGLDILFSDHHLHIQTLDQLGEVIKTINSATDDKALQQPAFLLYVSDNHPSVLQVSPNAAFIPAARALLEKLTLPEVKLLPGRQGLPNLQAQLARKSAKRWWQFWKRDPSP